MLGEEPGAGDSMKRVRDMLDDMAVRFAIDPYDERSALVDLWRAPGSGTAPASTPRSLGRVMLTGAVDA